MEICYDISAAARAASKPGGMTGVPRVVENLLRELIRVRASSLRLCAPGEPFEGWRYFRSDLSQSGADFINDRFSSHAGQALTELHRAASHGRRRLSDRLTRAALYRLGVPFLRHLDPRALAKADIYHSPHGGIPAQVRAARTAKGCPRIALTVYDLIPFKHPEYFLPGMADAQRAILATARPQEDWYLCISECTKRDLCELFGIDPARVFVTPLAADPAVFYPCPPEAAAPVSRRYGLPDGPYVMSLCTLEPRKNVRTIIEGFARLVHAGEIEDLHLLLVGGKGWLDEGLQEAIRRWPEVRRRIILPGFVPDEDLAALYSGALCFAYLSFYEGFGLPPLEAMQCGTPVLAANTSSLPEVVGGAGRLLAPGDAEGFAREVTALWRDPAARASLSAQALERAGQFTWERCARETLAVYQAMLAA